MYNCLELAKVVETDIRKIMKQKNETKGLNLKVSRAPFSLSLVFNKVIDPIKAKYCLSQQDFGKASFNHLFILKNIVKDPEVMNQLYTDMRSDNAFDEEVL